MKKPHAELRCIQGQTNELDEKHRIYELVV